MANRYPWQTFVDHTVYHDFHFNGMQLSIAKEMKMNFVESHYSPMLLVHPKASYFWFDSLVDTRNFFNDDGVKIDNKDLSLTLNEPSGFVIWEAVSLPEPTKAAHIYCTHTTPSNSQVEFEITFDGGSSWKPAPLNEEILVGDDNQQSQSIRLRLNMEESTDKQKPKLYDIAVFWN